MSKLVKLKSGTKNDDLQSKSDNQFFPYLYQDLSSFLTAYISFRKKSSPLWSMRTWAKVMKLNNPGYFSMVINGKRRISEDLEKSLVEQMKLDPAGQEHFFLLCKLSRAKTQNDIEALKGEISKSSHKLEIYRPKLEGKKFKYTLAHLILLDLCMRNGCKDPVDMVRCAVLFPFDLEILKQAFEDLLSNDMIRQSNGVFQSVHENVHLRGTPSEEIRAIQKQVLDLAKLSLTNHSPALREISTRSVWIPDEKLPKVKELLRRFQTDLVKECGDPGQYDASLTLYQFSSAFFPVLGPLAPSQF